MKRVLKRAAMIVIAAVTMSMAVQAQQKGDMAAGGNLVIGLGDNLTNVGIGAKFQYNVTDPIRLEGSISYFLEKNYVSFWDLSVNGHYLFPLTEQITVYPLVGVGLLGYKANFGFGFGSSSKSEFGVNLGGGIDYKLTDKLILNAETKYKIGNEWDRELISVGVAYKF